MSDQTDKTLGNILATLDDQTQLLRDILAALKSSARPATSQATQSAQTGPEVYPQPLRVISIEDAEETEVHFGKNAGKKLRDLGEKSVSWYALEKPPQLKKDGTPFDPRPQDVALTEAARTLHHARAGTLATNRVAAPAATTKAKDAPKQAALPSYDEVPF